MNAHLYIPNPDANARYPISKHSTAQYEITGSDYSTGLLFISTVRSQDFLGLKINGKLDVHSKIICSVYSLQFMTLNHGCKRNIYYDNTIIQGLLHNRYHAGVYFNSIFRRVLSINILTKVYQRFRALSRCHTSAC